MAAGVQRGARRGLAARPGAGSVRGMGRHLWARLAIALGILGAGLYLQGTGHGVAPEAEFGFYGVLVLAFLATAVSAAWLRRARRPERFAMAQIGVDLVAVSGLVLVTGRDGSIFPIGYALLTIYGSILFEARGAVAVAAFSTVLFGVVLFGPELGWLPRYGPGRSGVDVLLAVWGVNAGALLLVTFLSSALAGELQRTGAALDRSTGDLERLRRLHQRTVESLTSGVLTTDAELRITSFNPEAERITGVARGEVLGRPLEDVLPGAAGIAFGTAGSGRPRRARIRFRNRCGEERFVGVAGSTLREDADGAAGYVLIFQDVTAVVEMEAELRRSERLAAAGQLAANMAHELRNPLAAILGSIQMLEGALAKTDSDPEHQRLTEIVHRETDRLDGLLRDFLQFARPAPPRRDRVGLRALVEETLELFEASKPPDVRARVDIEPALRVAVDPAQLRQVLWNLFLNASQAMPEGGELRIGAAVARQPAPQETRTEDRNGPLEEGPEAVEITVRDSGIGISPDVLDRIFDPFFTTRAEGSGLGLANVLRTVESHGGTLRVESAVGQGTAFRLWLPRAETLGAEDRP